MTCFVFNLSTTALLTYFVSLFRTILIYPGPSGLHAVMQTGYSGVQMGYTGGTVGYTGGTLGVQWGYRRGTVGVQWGYRRGTVGYSGGTRRHHGLCG